MTTPHTLQFQQRRNITSPVPCTRPYSISSFYRIPQRPPPPTLFPYTTLFRSRRHLPSGHHLARARAATMAGRHGCGPSARKVDRKSTRLNSSHVSISYAVFCLKKKKKKNLQYAHQS